MEMRLEFITVRSVGILLLSGLSGFFEVTGRTEAAGTTGSPKAPVLLMTREFIATETNQQAAPRFVYASGAQGVRYYPNTPGQGATTAPRTNRNSGTRPRTVGPGVRDWTTGQRLGSHKPWLQSRG